MQAIEAMSFRVKISPHALNQSDFVSDTAENRAGDIHDFFADTEVLTSPQILGHMLN